MVVLPSTLIKPFIIISSTQHLKVLHLKGLALIKKLYAMVINAKLKDIKIAD
jgi:hypothetical protein